ncbi:MAG: hypothetical protein H0X46_05220 [Bacteroidetes bacterium]|nr:hypothetical protein [Bacteroidota bacterium]
MKTEFKNHIKFGSCWYDNFFKVSRRQDIKSADARLTRVSLDDSASKDRETYREPVKGTESSY